jgi:hypothetical protein
MPGFDPRPNYVEFLAEKKGALDRFSPSTSLFPYHYHFKISPYSFIHPTIHPSIHLPPTQYYVSKR